MVDLGVTTGPLLRWLSIFSESLASLSPRLPISFFLLPPLKLEESSFLFFFSFQIEDWEILIHYVFYWLCEILLRVTWNTCLRLIIELKSWQNFCLVGLFIVCRIILRFVVLLLNSKNCIMHSSYASPNHTFDRIDFLFNFNFYQKYTIC